MQGHYKDFWASTGVLLFFAVLLLDTVLLLWAYQVGQWLGRAEDQPQRKDGRCVLMLFFAATLLGGWLLL